MLETGLSVMARENPREAFEAILRLHQSDVRILTRRHFGDSAEADEVAQQVFLHLYKNMSTYRQEGSLRAWVLAITRNQIRLHIRNESRRKRRSGVSVSPELLDVDAKSIDADPFLQEAAQIELGALHDCLQRLGEHPRALIEAFYFQGQSADSIAAETGKNAGAIRMMLLRIRKQLGKCIRGKLSLNGGDHL